MTTSQVTVDPDLCTAEPPASSAELDVLADVVRSCPTGAVRVTGAQGNEL